MAVLPRLLLVARCLIALLAIVHIPADIQAQSDPPVEASSVYLPLIQKPIRPSAVELVNTLGGYITGAVVAGDFAYINKRVGLSIVNISDPTHIQEVGWLAIRQNYGITDIKIQGTRVYLAAQESGLAIVDVSNPATPTEIGRFTAATPVLSVEVSGNLAYLAIGAGGVAALDVSNPGAPVVQQHLATSYPANIVRLGGAILYVVTSQGKLLVIDRGSLQVVSEVLPPEFTIYKDVAVDGTIAYAVYSNPSLTPYPVIASHSAVAPQIPPGPGPGTYGIQVLNMADPAYPDLRGTYQKQSYYLPRIVIPAQGWLYIGIALDMLVLDVQNPNAPTEIGQFNLSNRTLLQINGERMYLSDLGRALTITDKLIPGSGLQILGTYVPQRWKVGPLEVVDNRLHSFEYVYDISVATQPTLLTSGESPDYRGPGFDNDFAVGGNLVYVARSTHPSSSQGSLTIYNLQDPANPVVLSSLASVGGVFGVEVVEQYAYLVGSRGFQVVDISNPQLPVVVVPGSDTASWGRGVAIKGNRAYVVNAYGLAGLQVFDISEPAAPVLVTTMALTDGSIGKQPEDIRIANNLAYIRIINGGVQIVDISNPDAPVPVHIIEPGAQVFSIQIRGPFLYMTTGQGLRVYNIANPIEPVLVTYYDLISQQLYGLALKDDLVYLTNWDGFYILRLVLE